MQALCTHDLEKLKRAVEAVSIDDRETLNEVKRTYEKTGYVLDPHTAVGVAAARRVRSDVSGEAPDFIVLATAHPAKFAEIIEPVIGKRVAVPERLQEAMGREKSSVKIAAEYKALRGILT